MPNASGTRALSSRYLGNWQIPYREYCSMRTLALWLIGIPIPVIILLYVFNVL